MHNKILWKEFIRYASLNILGTIGLSAILADTFLFLYGLEPTVLQH